MLRGSRAGLTGTGAVVVSRASAGVPGAPRKGAMLGRAVGVLNLDGRGPLDVVASDPGLDDVRLGWVLTFSGGKGGPRYRSGVAGTSVAVPGLIGGLVEYGRRLGGGVNG